jgi:hypothetical protein
MISNNVKTAKEIVKRELLDLKKFCVDVKDIKDPFQWGEKHEFRFPIVCFLTKQILGSVGFQIETRHILINLRICWL